MQTVLKILEEAQSNVCFKTMLKFRLSGIAQQMKGLCHDKYWESFHKTEMLTALKLHSFTFDNFFFLFFFSEKSSVAKESSKINKSISPILKL